MAARDEPELASKFITMVEDDSVAIIDSRAALPEFMYRQGMSLRSIIESYKDVSREIIARTVKSTFETGSCSESCEAFAE